MSACVVLAWCLLALMAAAGVRGPDHPVAQANTSTATSISTANSSTPLTLVSDYATARPALVTHGAAHHRVTAVPVRRSATWTVRPGDTLSAIAAALGVPGGWQALYAANRPAIGPDPGLIHAGTVLIVAGQKDDPVAALHDRIGSQSGRNQVIEPFHELGARERLRDEGRGRETVQLLEGN